MSNTTPTQSKKVLIIEDEGDMCLLMNIILAGRKMQLDHVKSLADAQSYLEDAQPQVVLLDNKLPDGFGVDFIPQIKKQNPLAKIIMISGFDASAADIALENGADVFLTKPFTKEQLQDSVSKCLS
jgi:two-component system, OmpR family, response regulator